MDRLVAGPSHAHGSQPKGGLNEGRGGWCQLRAGEAKDRTELNLEKKEGEKRAAARMNE